MYPNASDFKTHIPQQVADSRGFVAHTFVVQNSLPLITAAYFGHMSNTTNPRQTVSTASI